MKIERAKEHIRDFIAEAEEFMRSDPYSVPGEEDPATGDWVVRVHVRESPPLRLGAIAADAVHNLRAALDLLWAEVTSGGEPRAPGRRSSAFPIYNSESEFRTAHARRVRSRLKEAIATLASVKPYKGGNDPLWLLRELDNEDKHRAFVPALGAVQPDRGWLSAAMAFLPQLPFDAELQRDFATRGLRLETDAATGRPLVVWRSDGDPSASLRPIEHLAEVARVPGAERGRTGMLWDFRFRTDLVFGESEVAAGRSILQTLDTCGFAVEEVAAAFTRAGLL